MNIFEILFLIVWIAFGVGGSIYGWHAYEQTGAILGFILGFVLPFCIFKGINIFIDWWIPLFPSCVCGNSRKDFYIFNHWIKNESGTTISSVYICQKCGRKYIKSKRQFQLINEHGDIERYMFHPIFGRWQRDIPRRVKSLEQ